MNEQESKNKRRPNRLQKELPKDAYNISPSQIRPLRAVQAHHEGEYAASYMHTIEDSPWKFYDKIYGLRLGESDVVTVAEDKGISRNVVTIRRFSGAAADKQLEMTRLVQHKNLVTAHEVYRCDGDYYVIFEHMPLSLQEVAANPYLNEPRLAAIVGQIVEGLAYLEDKALQHGRLTCSDILLHPNGNVKLCLSAPLPFIVLGLTQLCRRPGELHQPYRSRQGYQGPWPCHDGIDARLCKRRS